MSSAFWIIPCFQQMLDQIFQRSLNTVCHHKSRTCRAEVDGQIAGINDDGPMHPRSPRVSAPDGAVTLMYKMGRENWLERFLDVGGTRSFKLVMKEEPWQDLYIQRDGRAVEVGPLCSLPTQVISIYYVTPLVWLPYYLWQHYSSTRTRHSLYDSTFRRMGTRCNFRFGLSLGRNRCMDSWPG